MNNKIEEEKIIVKKMISIYCKKKHNSIDELCFDCNQLYNYALNRLELCPYKDNKHFCSSCHVHCYERDKQEQIRNVMKFSGPRLLFTNPIMSIKHLFVTIRKK